jgi:hypothetical protein
MANLQCIGGQNGGGAASNTLAVPSSTAGSCLGLIIGIDSTESLTSVSDPINGTWSNLTTATIPVVVAAANVYVALFPNNAGWASSENLTITLNASKDACYIFFEESGILTSGVSDGGQGQNQASATSWNTPNLTTANSLDILYTFAFSTASATMGFAATGSGVAVTGTGITSGAVSNTIGACAAFMARWAVSSTGTYSGTGTNSTSGGTSGVSSVIIALKQPGGGGGGGNFPLPTQIYVMP